VVILWKQVEGKACEEGIRLALQLSNKPIMVELDCSVLIDAIKKRA
jgi:hypothetical protein